jgi:hypothetical protein
MPAICSSSASSASSTWLSSMRLWAKSIRLVSGPRAAWTA